jgi:hypothetical protein
MPLPFRRLPSGAILVDIAKPPVISKWRCRRECRLMIGERTWPVERVGHDHECTIGQALSEPPAMVIVVEHRDRLARFNPAHQ